MYLLSTSQCVVFPSTVVLTLAFPFIVASVLPPTTFSCPTSLWRHPERIYLLWISICTNVCWQNLLFLKLDNGWPYTTMIAAETPECHARNPGVTHMCLFLETNKCGQCHRRFDFAPTTVTAGWLIDSSGSCQSVVESRIQQGGQ
ncbi:hypothetical protein F5J12DRAFT_424367 [Pisolithus orientalis]|uniref:uncharacterized protein n=1 Tax=Pisolithus orientalis TaxID=936130 RepID=UPI002224DCAB|nr:uncharacterized protein F5J12DRAFT_424367 [Pisolithus orientalis]KAI5993831.1 hypothetical protein F5J12DRAFT_424367 [Pisolithus orientalis]